ncbi:MAG: ATP-binding domain-containing protein [Pseudomonadota bacterium]
MTSAQPLPAFNDPLSQTLSQIADECLAAMEKIANSAEDQFGRGAAQANVVIGGGNAFNNPEVGRNLRQIQDKEQRAAYALKEEPLVARVKVQTASGEELVYYFGRNYSVAVPGIKMAGYTSDAPVARLASLPVGDTFRLPGGQEVEVIETGSYQPRRVAGAWDGVDNSIRHVLFDKLDLHSLQATRTGGLLSTTTLGDPFAAYDQQVVWTAPQRKRLQGTGLRNQEVMNKVQDEIFRLPLSRQIMMEGPPGTGKTSTLIKRLAQKLSLTQESSDDWRLINENTLAGEHHESWIMFSPTELLEHYLREAFNRDNVPAPQNRIQTWAGYRNTLATRVLNLLRSGSRKTGFQREETAQFLSDRALADQPGLHRTFDQFQREMYRAELDTALATLSDSREAGLQDIARRIVNRLSAGASVLSIYVAVDALAEDLRAWVLGARETLTADVTRRIDVLARRRAADIGALQQIVARMNAPDGDEDEPDDEDDGLEAEAPATSTGEQLRRALRGAIRAMAMSRWNKRAVARNSIYRPVIDWLGEGAVADGDLLAMGRIYALISAVGRVNLVTRNYFSKLPNRYRAFRRAAPATWFLPRAAEAIKLTYDELDLLVAIHLEAAQELMSSQQVRGNLGQGNLQVLAPLLAEFRNQVVVDEATDFTPLQLRAMASLATPGIRSFFACGDFNQRLATHGVADRADMEWAVPGLDFRTVTRAYRQSAELRSFADRVIELAGGALHQTLIEAERGSEGHAPTAFFGPDGLSQSRWIAQRIEEISEMLADLPSVAVFVPDEAQVVPVAAELRAALADTNIEVMPCPGGQVLGREQNVRVFAVQHIKGLEFEAAFFHSVQNLAQDHPGLFDKFLYVGATRAATFLGLAATEPVPSVLREAARGLSDHWSL